MQWVPSTYKKLVNITKTYGSHYVGRGPGQHVPFLADQRVPRAVVWSSAKEHSLQLTTLKNLHDAQVPFIDLRDRGEASAFPIHGTANFSPNDLLSGALLAVLPKNKDATMVVFASSKQRAINGFNALRRHGYHNILVADAAIVDSALSERNGSP